GGQNGFYDRIDLTLNEIRYMMLGEAQSKNHMVRYAVERESSWFALFKAKTGLEQFMRFINTFHLQPFVFDSDYKVLSLAESDIAQGVYIPVSVEEPIFPRNFKRYVKNNLIAIENRRC
ncbi:MAG: hypothetical protein LUF84_04760, partial [Clostridiales bacterium]|nr:hypothetical protein [Clostridiales bacterium]